MSVSYTHLDVYKRQTLGHYDIIERTSKIMDKVIIGVLQNKSKTPLFSSEERVNMLKEVTASLKNVEVRSLDVYKRQPSTMEAM